ncbi:MAG: ABC transporter ATP-binding protein [Actinomycetota bacterium]
MSDPASAVGTPGGAAVLAGRGLTKEFYGVRALDEVDFDLVAGEVHGLLGENGAGKSTLCSILAGLYRADAGSVLLDGEPLELRSPIDAGKVGIGMVYQHFRLVSSFTVAENVALGMKRRRTSRRQLETEVAELADVHGFEVDPTAQVWQLSVGEQQRVEILRQLYRGARVLILDEPTAVLAPQEAERLFEAVRQIADQGRAVVLVSHKMREILGHTDRVTVLRHGVNAGSGITSDLDVTDLRQMMFGTSDHDPAPRRDSHHEDAGRPVLRVTDLRVTGDRGVPAVHSATFSVGRGEIVGVAGVAGNGQRELHEALAGLRAATGSVVIDDIECNGRTSRQRAAAGLSYIPEDRLGTALAPGLPLDHNVVLKSYRRPPHSRLGFLRRRRIQETTEDLTDAFDVRGARKGLQVSLMSGGNLQKAIVGREVTGPHEVLVTAAPTRGLDLAAAGAVRDHVLAERAAGRGVLVFSEDLAEVVDLADVLLVMFQGEIVGRFARDEVDVDHVGLLMTGGAEELT